MRTIDHKLDQDEWYAPDWDDNRSCPDGDRFEVLLRAMTGFEKRKVDQLTMKAHSRKADLGKLIEDLRENICTKHVLEVRGIAIRADTGNLVEPTTGRDLYRLLESKSVDASTRETILSDLVNAVQDASVLEAWADKKKSNSRSGSLSLETNHSNGSAHGAAMTTTTSSKSAIQGAA